VVSFWPAETLRVRMSVLLRAGCHALAGLLVLASCATTPAIGQRSAVYEIRVASLNGMPTASRGPLGYPACVLQVGDRVARVWLADPSRNDASSPVVMEADADALKNGILVERSWREAVVHQVTDAELAAGAAVVYVPSLAKPTVVELRFERAARLSRSDGQDHLTKGHPGFENPVSGGSIR
jgi:hypothetical protein